VLATALVGRAPPVHSVGLLPLPYLAAPLPSLAALALANAAQLTRQAHRKAQVGPHGPTLTYAVKRERLARANGFQN
jgi:hypothetical protein